MNKATRKAVIAGNWKMNNNRPQTKALIAELLAGLKTSAVDVIVGVPFTNLETALQAAAGTPVKVSAQNVHFAESGAYTGEISAAQLKELGVPYAIIGHSERRQYFGETDQTVNLRTKAALSAGIIPIVCVGEYLQERQDDITGEVLSRQLKLGLKGLTADEVAGLIIAYEPVWAIGTGETATAEQAQEACKLIRDVIVGLHGKATADSVVIQYGGSMNAKNARELLSKPDVDGGLIGGASLKSADFLSIINDANDLY